MVMWSGGIEENRYDEKVGVYKAGKLPVWSMHAVGKYYGNSIVIEGDPELIIYDVGCNLES